MTLPILPEDLTLVGPWDEAFMCLIPIQIKSKSNYRRSKGSNNWQSFNKFEEDVKILVKKACPETWVLGDKAKELKSRPVVVNFIYAQSALDTANLSKSVLDGCENIVFHTDASVRACSAISTRVRSPQWGVTAFARLDPASSIEEITQALHSLNLQVLKNIKV